MQDRTSQLLECARFISFRLRLPLTAGHVLVNLRHGRRSSAFAAVGAQTSKQRLRDLLASAASLRGRSRWPALHLEASVQPANLCRYDL